MSASTRRHFRTQIIPDDNQEITSQLPKIESSQQDALVDIQALVMTPFKKITSIRYFSMSAPVFITILVIFSGFAFFAGRMTAGKQTRDDDKTQNISRNDTLKLQTASPSLVMQTPDEIIAQVRTEFAKDLELAKRQDLTQAQLDDISKSIVGILEKLTKAINDYPDVHALYFERAQIEKMVMQSGQNLKDQAESDYQKAISLSPLSAVYYIGYADFFDVQKNTGRAIEVYEQALKLDPKSLDALYALSRLYTVEGRTAEAKTHYERILSLLPSSSAQYAQIQKEMGELETVATASAQKP